MKHAFLFTSYRNSKNLSEAIRKLSNRNSEFFIHVDKKVDLSADKWFQQLKEQPNVTFLENRVKVNWGGYYHVEAIIRLMKRAIKDTRAEYIHLLSDSCYPIKTARQIDDFFEQNRGKEYIDHFALPTEIWPYGGLDRIETYHLHDVVSLRNNKFYWNLDHYLMLVQKHLGFKRKKPEGWGTYHGGSTWWSLSWEAVAYCIDRIDAVPAFRQRFTHTFCFEEILMQTLLLDSPFKDRIVNDNKRYILWEKRNGNIPAVLDMTDYEALKKSGKLFARKFTGTTSDELKQCIDEFNQAHTPASQ